MIGAVLHLESDLYDVLRGPGLNEYFDEHLHDLRQLGTTHMFVVDLTTHGRMEEWDNADGMIEKIIDKNAEQIYTDYPDAQFIIMETEDNLFAAGLDVNDFDYVTSIVWPENFILVTAPDISSSNYIDQFKGRDRVQFLNISQVPVVFSPTALLIALYERMR